MGNATDLRKRNITDILYTLHEQRVGTKNAIAQKLGLSPVTVHNLINELSEQGVCIETGEYVSNGGRNATLYQVNEDYGYLIGIDVRRHKLVASVYNMGLVLQSEETFSCELGEINAVIEQISAEIVDAIEKMSGKRILGVGITIPGRANKYGEVINLPEYPRWRGIPLQKLLEHGNCPIYIDNDNNALALAVKWQQMAGNCRNYVYLNTTEGLGCGVISHNALFHGSNGYGCEIGHTSIDRDGPLCPCGNRGCLQVFASDGALLGRLEKIGCANLDEGLAEMKNAPSAELRQAFDDTALYIALTIEHLLKVIDPEAVFLQCKWLLSLPEYLRQIREEVYERCGWVGRDQFSISLIDASTVQPCSSACIVLEKLYSPLPDNPLFSQLLD